MSAGPRFSNRWWSLMRLTLFDAEARRLRRAAALHRRSDASVKRAALDQVDRTHEVRAALAALLAEMDGRRAATDGNHAPPRDPA